MGNNNTSSSSSTTPTNSPNIGYRILGIHPNTPADKSDLIPFFDFIVGCNGNLLFQSIHAKYVTSTSRSSNEYTNNDDIDFQKEIQKAAQNYASSLELLVYNIKSRSCRCVSVSLFAPLDTRIYGDCNTLCIQDGLLGAIIRLDDYSAESYVEDQIIRCLDVKPGSPADCSGIHPFHDYILGTNETVFSNLDIFADVLQVNENRSICIYIYSSVHDTVRVVRLVPTYAWVCSYSGADTDTHARHNNMGRISFSERSLFGAEVGIGFLHRLPAKCRETNGRFANNFSTDAAAEQAKDHYYRCTTAKECLSDIEAESVMVTKDDLATQDTTSLGTNNDDDSDDESDISDISHTSFQFSRPLDDYQPSSSQVLHSDNNDNGNSRDQSIDFVTGMLTVSSIDVVSESIQTSCSQVDDILFTRNVMNEVGSECDKEKLGVNERGMILVQNRESEKDCVIEDAGVELKELEREEGLEKEDEEDNNYNHDAFHLVSPMDPFTPFPIFPSLQNSLPLLPDEKSVFEFPPPPKMP